MFERTFMKLDMCDMAPDPSPNGVRHEFVPPFCLCVPLVVAGQRLGDVYPSLYYRGSELLDATLEELSVSVYPHIDARQHVSKCHRSSEKLLEASPSMRSVSNERRAGDYSFPELTV